MQDNNFNLNLKLNDHKLKMSEWRRYKRGVSNNLLHIDDFLLHMNNFLKLREKKMYNKVLFFKVNALKAYEYAIDLIALAFLEIQIFRTIY